MNQRIRYIARVLGDIPAGWWIVLLLLPALVPLGRVAFFASHDGLLHAYRLAALDQAVRAGAYFPRWYPGFAFGYGHPVLNFYGPLSYYWGLFFTLFGIDVALAMKLVFATGLLASSLGMYLFARLHLGRGSALIAAIVYAFLPYHLADLYVRGAVAEFLAFVWFPLVLWAFHRLVEGHGAGGFPRLALAALLLCALVVTHGLSTLLFAPVLASYVLFMLLRHPDRWLRVVLALGLGMALSAFHWAAVVAESRYVGLAYGISEGYRDHLLPLQSLLSLTPTYSYAPGPDGSVGFPLGMIQVAIIVASLPVAFSRRWRWPGLFFELVVLFSALMLTTASLPVWRALASGLALLQYPWRFQMLIVLGTAFLAGILASQIAQYVSQVTRRTKVAPSATGIGLTLALAGFGLLLAWSLWRLPITATGFDPSVEAMWRLERDAGQIGTTWTGEYLPIWVREQRWAISLPTPASEPGTVPLPAGQVRLNGIGYTSFDLTIDAPEATVLVVHQFHYPGWQAKEQGASDSAARVPPIDSSPTGNLGLAAFDLPAGSGSVTVRLALTPAQRWGTLVSLVAALLAGVALITQTRRSQTRNSLESPLLAAGYLLQAAILLAGLAMPNGQIKPTQPVNVNLEDTVELLAYSTDRSTYLPGDTVHVSLYWRALRSPDQDYKAFVHLTDAAVTRQEAQHDGDPGGGYTPTSRWLPGELVPDTHHLMLPADLKPGHYRLWAGMYEYETVRNLSTLGAETPTADNRALLGEIEVASP